MRETPEDIQRLQALLDNSIERAGAFLRRSFQMPEHSLTAQQLIDCWLDVQTVALATVVPLSSGVRLFVYPGVLVTNCREGGLGAVGGAIPVTLSVNEIVTLLLTAPASSVV